MCILHQKEQPVMGTNFHNGKVAKHYRECGQENLRGSHMKIEIEKDFSASKTNDSSKSK